MFLFVTCVLVTAFSANTREVLVRYNGSSATVDVSPDITSLVTVSVNGANVVVGQSGDVNDEITYRLSGASEDGSFVHTGDHNITLSFEGLHLTSQTGLTVQIKNSNRIAVVMKDGTDNTLTDKENGSQKACMVVKGRTEFQGGGSLTVNGRTKHALKLDGPVEMKESMGTLTVNSSSKDGIHTDEYVLIGGGVLNITTTGGGYWDSDELKTKAPSCINSASRVIVNGGAINMLSTGDGGKGIKCDSVFSMYGGSLTVRTTGARYIYELYDGDRSDYDNIPDSLTNSPKAVKADFGIYVASGEINLSTTQDGGEGLESKDSLTIAGGKLRINTYDDCINAAGDIHIDGGDLYLSSIDNDGIDTNQSIYITGGNIVTLGNYFHELGIDVNDRSPYKNLYITGGTIVCLGGTSQVVRPAACSGAQPALFYTGKMNKGVSLLLRCASDSTDVLRFNLDRDYTEEAAGTAPDLCLMLTAPALKAGNGYQLIDEATSGILASVASLATPYSDMVADDSRFSRQKFTYGQYSLPYRQADINLTGSVEPILVLYLHGGSARGSDNEAQIKEPGVSDIYNYLSARGIPATLIVPQCPAGGGWTSQLRKVVNELMTRYATDGSHDSKRVYVLGGSMGGTGTWTQLSYFPGFYAAAMPVAGNPTGLIAANVAVTPVRTVMGTADNMMSIPVVEQFQTDVLAAGGTLILDKEVGWTHQNTCELSYTDERLDWLFAHVLGEASGIDDVHASPKQNGDSTVYDLNGRQIPLPTHGIYIQNGKIRIR